MPSFILAHPFLWAEELFLLSKTWLEDELEHILHYCQAKKGLWSKGKPIFINLESLASRHKFVDLVCSHSAEKFSSA